MGAGWKVRKVLAAREINRPRGCYLVIGAAIAKRLAADGARIAFSYAKSPEQAQNVVADIERQGVQALAVQADQVA